MYRVFVIPGHYHFSWLSSLCTLCVFSIQVTHEYRFSFSGSVLFWTIVEWLGSTYGQTLGWSYVVSLHMQRCDKKCWQGVWKNRHAKERILICVFCICSSRVRDPPLEQKQKHIQVLSATLRKPYRQHRTTPICSEHIYWCDWSIVNIELHRFTRMSVSTGAIFPSRSRVSSIPSSHDSGVFRI